VDVAEAPAINFAKGGSASDVYALVVGVSEYPDADDNLPGVATDVQRLAAVLREEFGVKPENLAILENQQATHDNIAKGFAEHLSHAGKGGTVVFYYSGHGVLLDENAGLSGALDPEEDGLDEALYVYDGVVLDDEIGILLSRLSAENVVVIFDSCYSGKGTRGLTDDPTLRRSKEISVKAIPEQRRHRKTYIGMKTPKYSPDRGIEGMHAIGSETTPRKNMVFLAASAEGQVSWIAPDAMGGSVFTYYLTQELTRLGKAKTLTSFNDLMQPLKETTYDTVFNEYGAIQQPQVEGDLAAGSVVGVLKR
jgi:hypothetical protein